MKTKFNGILTLLLALVVQISFAQERPISGTVSDKDGTLPGVSILIRGTTNGTETDFDGKYSINAKTGDVLVFSYLGYNEIQKEVTKSSNIINATLEEGGVGLDEIVVVAFGKKRKEQLTSAVSVISSEELAKMSPSLSVDNMLQGKATGVQVVGGNGKPGQTAFVRIRGVGSVNASSAPLYIIDGVVAPGLNNINPQDIESMSVLKDAATASKYGSRAANGVIVIVTKTGKKNKKAVVTLSNRYGIGRRIKDNFKMMNAEQKIQYERELAALGVSNAASLPGPNIANVEEYNALVANDTDWFEELLKDAEIQSTSVSVAGGSEEISYFFSVGHDTNTGIIQDISGFKRSNVRMNLDYEANDWLNISTNFSFITSKSTEPRDRNNVQNPFRAMYDYNPYETKFNLDSNGNPILDENGNPEYNLTSNGFSISEALVNNPEAEYNRTLIGGLTATAKIAEGLTNTFKIGGSNTDFRREFFVKPGSVLDGYVGDADNPGSKTDNGSSNLDYTLTNLLEYNKVFNEKHDVTLTGLFEFNERILRNYSLSSIGFANPDLSVQAVASLPDAASTNLFTRALLSYGGFLDYSYDDKYIATASVRRDGSSVFGENNRYGVFWSTSAGWNIHKEDWFKGNFFNNLKLRASAGTSGNSNGLASYGSLASLEFGSLNGQGTAIPTDNGNPNLGFEKNFIWDIGVEFSALNRRLRGVIDYYQRTTSDLLLNAPLSSLGGEPDGSIFSNIGEMVNKGLEIEITGDIIRTNDVLLTLGASISFVDNEVTKLVGTPANEAGEDIIVGNNIVSVGEEIYTYYLPKYAGVNSANGQPLFYDKDNNVTNVFDTDAQQVLSGKSPLADFDGGINLYFKYKNFDLSTDFYYKVGNYVLNFMESNMLSDGQSVDANQRVDAFNYWKNPGDTNVLPSPIYGNESNQTTDRFLQKGDYIRLRNLTIGYNVPLNSDLGINSVRLYLQGQNLWTYAPHFNGDPEVGIGSGETNNGVGFGNYNLYSYPQTQSLSFGVDIKF
jgi:TonB-linked SusC/RagA family outer membrane protein